jgi:hypothetical protein
MTNSHERLDATIDPPREFSTATHYLWYSVGVSAFNLIVDCLDVLSGRSLAIPAISLLAILVLSWLTYNVSRARDWARMTSVAYVLVASPVLFVVHATVFGLMAYVAMIALQLLAIGFMFTRASTGWFQRGGFSGERVGAFSAVEATFGGPVSNTRKALIALGLIAVALIGVGGAWMVASGAMQSLFVGSQTPRNAVRLSELSSQANAKLPMMIDENTRLDKTSVAGRSLQYNLTLVKRRTDELDETAFAEAVGPKLVSSFCGGDQMRVFRENNVPVSFAYFGSDGGHVATITVSRTQCDHP